MTKTIARLIAATAAAAALATFAIGAPAQATAPAAPAMPAGTPVATFAVNAAASQNFHLEYGASVTDGTISFSDRSVSISGYVKAVSASRTVLFVGYNENISCIFEDTRTASAGTTRPFGFDRKCDIRGGFDYVDVYFPV